MPESKTYVFGNDANNGIMSVLSALCQQRGLDPNLLLALNGNNFGANGGGWFVWILFLLVLFGRNGNGLGGNGTAYLGNMLNNDAGRQCLEQAIAGNGAKLSELSTMLNCDVNSIKTAINAITAAIGEVGNKVGMNGMQVINAIQAGNGQIASQIAQCCCDQRLATCQQTNALERAINGVTVGQERGFSQLGFAAQQQTCELRDAIRQNTETVIAGQRAAELRELNRDIAERDRLIAQKDAELSNYKQTAVFGQMIQQAVGPIGAAINALQNDVNGMKCKLPETANVPYSPVVGVPTCVAAQYGLGLGLGFFNQWG